MKRGSIARVVLVGLVGIGAVFAAYKYKQSVITAACEGYVDELRAMLRADPGYSADGPYIDGLVDAFHGAAFERAFTAEGAAQTGGEVRITQFHRYTLDAMIARAAEDRAERAAATLQRVRELLE